MWITWVLHSSTNLGLRVESKDKPKLPSCTSTFFHQHKELKPSQGLESSMRLSTSGRMIKGASWTCHCSSEGNGPSQRKASADKLLSKSPPDVLLEQLYGFLNGPNGHRITVPWQHSDKAYLNRLGNETFVTCDTLCSTLCDTLCDLCFVHVAVSDIRWQTELHAG